MLAIYDRLTAREHGVRLDERMTAEAIERVLRREAAESFGADCSPRLEARLRPLAGWLALVAAEPLELEDAAPDQSGQPLDGDDRDEEAP